MRFKKVAAIVLALMLGATGCGSQGGGQDTGSAAKTTVDIFQFKAEISKDLESAAKLYEASHSGVKVNVQTVGAGADYGAALRAQFQSGNEPDVFNVGGPQDVADWQEKLEDLSDQGWVSLALDNVLDGVTVEGKVYALPFNMEGYGLIYNKGIFEAAGIDAETIKDYASLEVAVKTLDEKIKSGALKEQYPLLEAVFEYAAKETWVTGLHTSNAALSQEFDNSQVAFNSKTVEFKNAEGMKMIIDLMADYSPSAGDRGKLNAVDYSTQVDEGLAIERVAIIQQGNWVYSGIKDIDEKVADNLGILPMPIVGGREDCIFVGVPNNWAVNNSSSEVDKKAAKEFLNWLYTSDEGKDIVVNKFFFIPPLKGYDAYEPKDSLGKAVMAHFKDGKTLPWVFMGYPTGWGQEKLGAGIQKYLAGEATWDECISNAKAQWKELRK